MLPPPHHTSRLPPPPFMPRSSRPGKVSEEFILPQEKPPGGDENCSLVAQCKEDYARVSTDDQDTAVQVAALKAAGCERIYREKGSGGRWDRPELHRLLDQLRKGDVLVVWKLDRLSRSLRDVLTIMERLGEDLSRSIPAEPPLPTNKTPAAGGREPWWPRCATRWARETSRWWATKGIANTCAREANSLPLTRTKSRSNCTHMHCSIP